VGRRLAIVFLGEFAEMPVLQGIPKKQTDGQQEDDIDEEVILKVRHVLQTGCDVAGPSRFGLEGFRINGGRVPIRTRR